ncbi:carboxylate-amine ligase [Pseudomonas sp. NPDC090755]|uniref:carboxylate-amine ligase n=1 Tax=Pseudomonas sp. NPDC090755 TaxID=3364481 RepID=UPI00383A700A
MSPPCSFGIEEEYLLVELASGRVVARPGAGIIALCRQVLGAHFAQEMFRCQIEVASPVFTSLAQAGDFLRHHRQQLARGLAAEGVGLFAAGSHPMGGWRQQRPADEAHYRQLFEDYQQVARRSLLCGLHVHVGVAQGVDRMRLINQLLPWTPLLLLLSASSPFWEGEPSGYQSYRQVACGEWPHMGLPERLGDWQAYQRYLTLLRRTGSLREGNDCWWVIRPSRRYPTVELRIADACPRLEDALCIAGLFRRMVEHCLNHPQDAALTREQYWIAGQNYWRAMRHGRHGHYICLAGERQCSAQQWLAQARERFDAGPCDSERSFDRAEVILREGTSADWQLAVYERGQQRPQGALLAVVEGLVAMTGCC